MAGNRRIVNDIQFADDAAICNVEDLQILIGRVSEAVQNMRYKSAQVKSQPIVVDNKTMGIVQITNCLAPWLN